MGRGCRGIVGLAWAVAVCVAAAHPVRGEVNARDLQRRVDALCADIRGWQREDGSFVDPTNHNWAIGQTALAVLALRTAGVPAGDPAVRNGAAFLVSQMGAETHGVYQNSLRIMALEAADPRAYANEIAACARYLMRVQQGSGGWSYDGGGRTDNSNSQFAVLGLNSAAMCGVDVPEAVWSNAREYFALGQNRDGGWGYRRGGESYGSMTAAGLASIYICDLWLHAARGRCGAYGSDERVQGGLRWLADHFTVAENPGTSSGRWKFYYLYGLERAGVILARRYFGRHDWYRDGIEHLVGEARAVDRQGGQEEWELLRDCFMLLFLAKANAPLLVLKAQWGGSWQPHRYDARFLVQYVGRQLGQTLDWQIVPLSAPLDELMKAPILYISGEGPAIWSVDEMRRLKERTMAGGFVLVDAAKGDAAFDRAFRAMVKERFSEEQLVVLPKDHPIYSCYFDIPVDQRPRLEAIMGPCWISVLYAPDGLSCEWDVADFDHVNFKLGTNIVAYVTGMQKLEGKLTEPVYYVPTEHPAEERRGAFTLGQIVHSGNWQPHKVAWRRVLEDVNKKAGLTVYSRPLPIRIDVESPFQAQMLYLTGVDELRLDPEAQRALKLYLSRGGFLFAEAACGSKKFDESFRKLIQQMYPGQELKELPMGHPLFEGGEPLGPVEYSAAVREVWPDLHRPLLEFLELDGRAAVIYSRYDISSAIDGHPCHQCPSVLEPSAGRLAVKIVLYGLAS